MAKSYTINKSLTFSDATGYWALSLEVTSSSQVSPFPFLLEKAVLGTGSSTTLSSDVGVQDVDGNDLEQPSEYLRTLLESESATQRTRYTTSLLGFNIGLIHLVRLSILMRKQRSH